MRDLVVCCDGTWFDAVDLSNVRRFHDLLDEPVIAKYVPGVGTGHLVDTLRGGLTGAGLGDALRDGYRFLVDTYRPGDRISLFGFSRGAYTARSLAGLVGRVGIADGHDLDERGRAAAVTWAYERYKALKDEAREQPGVRRAVPWPGALRTGTGAPPLAYDPGSPDIPIALVGVWDTVGALGIPGYVGVPDLLGSRRRYEFLDVVLDRRIPHARHAVSLDDLRGPFRPTLWAEPVGAGQDVAQVWFPGDHCDVGGGHADTRLSSGALAWMVDEAEAAVGLPFRPAQRSAIGAVAAPDAVHGTTGGPWGALLEAAVQPRPRAAPLVHPDRREPGRVADSAYAIQEATRDLPRGRQYRPTRTLQPGERAAVTVEAREGWNATGLYLEEGTYLFEAEGRWSTPFGSSGPEGARRWPLVGDAFGRVVGLVEQGLRAVVANPEAELAGARREADAPLMVLVGFVANEVTDARGKVTHADEKLVIGRGRRAPVERAGYFFAYANDAWGCYGNNGGRVVLTVTRLPA